MFGLVSSFSARMQKRAARAQEETTSNSKVTGKKRPKLSSLMKRLIRVQW